MTWLDLERLNTASSLENCPPFLVKSFQMFIASSLKTSNINIFNVIHSNTNIQQPYLHKYLFTKRLSR